MSIEITYKSIQDLSQLEAIDLEGDDTVNGLLEVFNTVFAEGVAKLTEEDIIKTLIGNNFYLPKLVAVNNQLGFYIGGGFRQISYNFTDADKIEPLKPTDPDRYNLKAESGEFVVDFTVTVQPKTKQLKFLTALSSMIESPEAIAEVIATILPEPISNPADGIYQVKSVSPGERSTVLTLESGLLVRTNPATQLTTTEITVINGFVYQSRDTKLVAGISLTGKSDHLLSVSSPEIGDVFTVLGSATTKGANGEYSVGRLSDSTGFVRTINLDGAVAKAARSLISRGVTPKICLTAIREITGNMKNRAAVWAVVR